MMLDQPILTPPHPFMKMMNDNFISCRTHRSPSCWPSGPCCYARSRGATRSGGATVPVAINLIHRINRGACGLIVRRDYSAPTSSYFECLHLF